MCAKAVFHCDTLAEIQLQRFPWYIVKKKHLLELMGSNVMLLWNEAQKEAEEQPPEYINIIPKDSYWVASICSALSDDEWPGHPEPVIAGDLMKDRSYKLGILGQGTACAEFGIRDETSLCGGQWDDQPCRIKTQTRDNDPQDWLGKYQNEQKRYTVEWILIKKMLRFRELILKEKSVYTCCSYWTWGDSNKYS